MKLLVVALIIGASKAQWYSNSAQPLKSWKMTFVENEVIFGLESEDVTRNETIYESGVDQYLLTLASEQLELITKLPAKDTARKYFFTERETIENTEEFKVIKEMPKGAALDVQDIGLGSVDLLWKCMTESPALYALQVEIGTQTSPLPDTEPETTSSSTGTSTPPVPVLEYTFKYVESPQEPQPGAIKISTLVATDARIKDIKASLFVTPPAETECLSDPEAMWKKYNKVYDNVKYIVTYFTTYETYIRESLKEMAADGVDYMEMKTALYPLHFNGMPVKSSNDVGDILLSVVQALIFKGTIVSCRLIYAPPRNISDSVLPLYADMGNLLNERFGTFVVGYDLQGQETDEYPLSLVVPSFKKLKLKKFCFQAGNTNLLGSAADDNLMDALYMEPSRISGAFSLAKRPYALDTVKKKNIIVSMNPIEHQLMGYCKNLRNHPITSLIANDVKVVISLGAPGLYGAKGASHSYYYALTAFGAKHSGLRGLKRLLRRGLNNNFMSSSERSDINQRFKTKWATYSRLIWGRSFNRPPKLVTV